MTPTPNPLDTQKLRRELLLEQAINKHLDELVRLATEAVLTIRLPLKKDKEKDKGVLEESQLRNLVAVANQTPSIEVITNFIRYQIGRSQGKWSAEPNGFGHTIIRHLYNNIAGLADQVAIAVATQWIAASASGAGQPHKAAPQSPDPSLRAEAYITLARQYIGYLNRTFYFYKNSDDREAARKTLKEVIDRHQPASEQPA